LPDDASKVVLGDTPRFELNPAACLSDHVRDSSNCERSAAEAVDGRTRAIERRVARLHDGHFIDVLPWICPSGSCPLIRGNILTFRDSHHLTTAFSRLLANELAKELDRLNHEPVLALSDVPDGTGSYLGGTTVTGGSSPS
jgi:hypothetical protein